MQQLSDWIDSNGGATASDNCGQVAWSSDYEGLSDDCGEAGSATVTFTATDDCGNTSTAEQVITLVDDEAPVIDMEAADETVECDGQGNMADLNTWLDSNGGASATDNCSNFEWSHNYVALSDECGATGSVTVIFTATDDCDNASSTAATFTIEDTTVPDMTEAFDQTVDCDGMGNMEALNEWLDSYGGATASDICSGVTWSSDYEGLSDGCGATGSAAVTFTATDDCGNVSSTTATFTIEDTTNPDITAASDETVECDGMGNMDALNGWLNNNGGATASDVCSGVTWSNDFEGLSDDCGATGSSTVTFTATDDCGNASSVSATFTIEDTTDPVFDPFMSTIMVECTDGDYSSPDYQPLTATDDCSGVEYEIESICMSGGCLWTVMRMWTATDDCGNSTTVEQFIMLIDTTAPVVTAPAPYNVDADADDCSADISATADVAGVATVEDNCGSQDCWGMESLTVWSEDADLEVICGYDMEDQGSRSIVRTWYAQDRCGNIGQDTQIITISDVTPPVASVTDESVACADYDPTAEYGTPVSSDNCAALPTYTWVNTEVIAGDCAGDYTVKRTYTFVDDCMNTVDVIQTISVFDDVAPVISGESQVDVECSSDYANTLFITASDACGSGAGISYNDVPVSGGCVQPVGMYQRTYTVIDDCGNESTFEQFLRLMDTTDPELTIPADYTIECDQDIVYDEASATDNCDGNVAMGYSEEIVDGDCPQSYEIRRTFTATDDCDNSVSATQTITVQDTTAPELTVPMDYTAECSDAHPLEDATATDNCGMVSIAMDADTVAGACAQSYVVTRTFTASDECGNETTLSQTITIEDTTAPSFNEALPGDMTAECDDVPAAAVLTAMDNCQDVSVSYSESRSDGDCPSNYTLTRVWSVSDDCNNATDHTQVVTIQDTTAPEFALEAADQTVECDGAGNMQQLSDWLDSNGGADASDNCGMVSISNDYAMCEGDDLSFIGYNQGSWGGNNNPASNAMDANFASIFPQGLEVGCDDLSLLFTTADAVDTYLPCTGDALDLVLTHGGQNPTEDAVDPTCWDNALVSHLLTAKLNVAFDAALEDFSPSSIALGDLLVSSGTFEGMSMNEVIQISDEVLGDCNNDYTPGQCRSSLRDFNRNYTPTGNDRGYLTVPGCWEAGCGSTGMAVVTFTAVDECGNSSSSTATFAIEDTVAPEIAGDAEVFVACGDYDENVGYATSADACGMVELSWMDVQVSGGCVLPIGQYVRTYTATDECGNASTFEQILTLTDTEAPVFDVVPSDYTTECDIDIIREDATASDNCSGAEVTVEEEVVAGDCPQSYQIVRSFTATDNCGNFSEASQTITVQDTTAPELTVPMDYTAECSDAHPLEDATATDNCGMVSIAMDADTVAGACAQSYVVTRTFTASDECGNETTLSQTITIEDTTAPEISADTEVSVACSDYDVNVAYATTTDNCGMVDLSWTDAPVSGGCVLPIGQYVRNYTATDECGNASTFEQILTLTDEVDPEFTAVPEGATYECFEEIEYLDATATDNCSGATVTVVADTVFSSDCMQTFTITRTFTATDNCGNSATATQVIEVQDTEGPDFTFVPEDYTAECSDELTLADAMATDHCSMVNIEVNTTEIPGTCEGNYTILREFVATDDCGNEASQTQVITIQDTTAPELSIPEDYTAECSDEHPLEDASATDNCSMVSIVMDADTVAGACDHSYVVTRTFTATDECGNNTSLSQVITIQDTTAPELTIPADYTAECDEELVFDDASASDNCGMVSIALEETTNDTDCAQEYSIVRTFTATDECGNVSVASQTITVEDTTDPVITSAGGLMNGQVIEVCCESLEGGITVPEAVTVSFTDNCDDAANLDYNEECIGGNCPTADVESWCEVLNPAVMPDGETCDNYSVHSMRLFNFPGSEFYTTIEGRVANNVDGTKTYTMTVVSSDNDQAGWEITNNYSAPMSWEDWIAQPGSQSYKSDCGLGDHTEWMYTMLTSGSATGWGDYAGSSLTFNHQPASGYFGFQIGEGANNKNGNYGFSAWMYYNGTFDGSPVSGSGDVFGDLDCCLPYDLSRSYVVTDCAGNDTDFGYTVRMRGEDCASGDAGDISDPEDSDLTFVKDLVKIASLQPNPTSDMSTLVLTTEEVSLQVEVTVMTMTGSTVMTLYNGSVVAGWPTTIEVPASQLESGMYQVKARAKTYVTTKKLLVAN